MGIVLCGCATKIPYLPASSEVPYGYMRGDQLHRLYRYDTKTGKYVKRDNPEIIEFDHDGISASYMLWKGRDSEIDALINSIGE
jgi:hypothetical protein